MKTKPANKKNIVALSILGALLVGSAALLGTVYGPNLKAGVSTFPNNPFSTRPTSTPFPTTSTTPSNPTCLGITQQRNYLTQSLSQLSLEIFNLNSEIRIIELRLEDENTTLEVMETLWARIEQMRARIEYLLEQKTGRERELLELLRRADGCRAPA